MRFLFCEFMPNANGGFTGEKHGITADYKTKNVFCKVGDILDTVENISSGIARNYDDGGWKIFARFAA